MSIKQVKTMKIVIDDKIPYIRETISMLTDDAVYKKGSEICAEDVRDADALIVRTRTRCDENLLSGSRVSFVATATIGFDHIDAGYMRRAGIDWMSCPGCNAGSVGQYIRSVFLLMRYSLHMDLSSLTVGIVGCGHVGSKITDVARSLGMRILICDPPRQERGDGTGFVTMDVIEHECDIITFHVPLTKDGPWPTYHMADEAFFSRLERRPVVINTSRGEVVDNAALLNALQYNKVGRAVIDTWEHEPDISLKLLDKVWIATPHIAGYSADGKVNADNMVIDGLCRHFGMRRPPLIVLPALPQTHIPEYADDPDLGLYNPLIDDRNLRSRPDMFEELRGNYRLRREKP